MSRPRSLADALADSSAGGLLHRLEQWRRVADVIAAEAAQLAPGFAAQEPNACQLKDGVLWLTTRSAAHAAKLRQGLPGLLRLLNQQGVQVNEIRVRVQPVPTGDPSCGTSVPGTQVFAEPLSPGAAAGAQKMAETLIARLPASALTAQLARLAQQLQSRRSK